jgi:trigger factor
MQNIETIKDEALEKHIKITIPSADIEKKYQDKMLEVQDMVRIPGYRPGKAPAWLVTKQYGDSVRQDVFKESVEESVKEVIKDLAIVGTPDLDDIVNEKGKDASFTVKFELFPEISMPDFSGIKIEKPTFTISEKEIEKELDNLLEYSTKYENKEGAAGKHDSVVIDIAGVKSNGEHFPQKEMKEGLFRLDKDYFLSKKFNEPLVGAKAGDKLEIVVEYDDKFENEQLANHIVTYSVNVHSVKTPVVPELNDEFTKTVGYDNVEDLKASLIKAKEAEYNSHVYTLLSMRLFDALEGMLKFEVPKSVLAREMEGISAEMENLKKEDSDLENKTEEEMKQYVEKFAYRRIRIGLMLEKYAEHNSLKLNSEDMQKAVLKRVSMYPEYMQQRMLDWYYKSPENLNTISGSALEQKVVENILANGGLHISEKHYDASKIVSLVEKETEKRMY